MGIMLEKGRKEMARIIRKKSDLKRLTKRYKMRLIRGKLIRVICILSFVLSALFIRMRFLPVYFLFVIIAGVNECYCKVVSHRYDILFAGLEGEMVAAKMISECLPKDYFAFQNVKVSYEGKTSEMDMVVVGKTGVYIVEIKNHKGTIEAKTDARYWVQHKIGEGGTPYFEEFYSPIKQVGTHVYRLAHYLRENGIRVHVNAIVYFSNPEADVRIYSKDGEIPVFAEHERGGKRLRDYILGKEQVLSKETVKGICRLLNE